MKQALKETRGRKKLKTYNLKKGELATFNIDELHNIRYAAKKSNWKISVRSYSNKLMVFRSW